MQKFSTSGAPNCSTTARPCACFPVNVPGEVLRCWGDVIPVGATAQNFPGSPHSGYNRHKVACGSRGGRDGAFLLPGSEHGERQPERSGGAARTGRLRVPHSKRLARQTTPECCSHGAPLASTEPLPCHSVPSVHWACSPSEQPEPGEPVHQADCSAPRPACTCAVFSPSLERGPALWRPPWVGALSRCRPRLASK